VRKSDLLEGSEVKV